MNHTTLLLIPVFVQVALTFALLFRLGPARVAAVKSGEVKLEDIALGQKAWPDRVTQISNAYANQFEMPVLFYPLVVLAIMTRRVDMVLVVGAWLFALSRLAHAFIHVTSNRIRARFNAFTFGVFVLLAMWAWFAWRVLTEGV